MNYKVMITLPSSFVQVMITLPSSPRHGGAIATRVLPFTVTLTDATHPYTQKLVASVALAAAPRRGVAYAISGWGSVKTP